MEDSNSVKLQQKIRGVVDGDAGSPAIALARTLFEKEGDLISAWALERITALIRAEQRSRPDPKQMFFPGFKNLSRKLPLGEGFVPLREATIIVLRKSAEAIQKANANKVDPKAAKIYQLIEAMTPYSKNHRGLTVERFYELRSEGATRPAIARKAAAARWAKAKGTK